MKPKIELPVKHFNSCGRKWQVKYENFSNSDCKIDCADRNEQCDKGTDKFVEKREWKTPEMRI